MIKGNIDLLTCNRVEGWACDTNNFAAKLSVHVLYDGKEILRGMADRKRNDLGKIHESQDFAFFLNFDTVADVRKISVIVRTPQGEEATLPFRGRLPSDAPTPRKPLPALFWGLWPQIDDYAQLSSETLFAKVGGNTGNLAFLHAICKQIDGMARGPLCETPVDSPKHIAVIPCANHLGSHCDLRGFADCVMQAKSRIVALGLGAQSDAAKSIPEIPQGTLDWVRAIADHAPTPGYPNITLRGPFTQQVLEHYGLRDVGIVMGCPSLFISHDAELGRTLARNFSRPRRVAVVAGNPYWKKLQKIEASLARIVTQTKGAYIAQHPILMVRLTRGEGAQLTLHQIEWFRNYTLPDMTIEETLMWLRTFGQVFFNADAWMEFYRHFDFVIGARIHGVLLALQAGVPAVCIAHDSRTQELCGTMRVPFVTPERIENGVELDDLERLFAFDPEEFDKNRRRLCAEYVEFLQRNGLTPASWLRAF
ncbi:polysaccharide pyruvyl transferase family protein [uncultured Desulfovibrio sp.]|uniref:polysaccharide pyruvyl transferase family protein n=1 Tax=uncultured Desulfovibrio sp. TaxID=167968 RepID=UPI002615B2C7|nr:polysaccharide pyruvyl transferase family protein [uncultured Desulfovibrio sp.]